MEGTTVRGLNPLQNQIWTKGDWSGFTNAEFYKCNQFVMRTVSKYNLVQFWFTECRPLLGSPTYQKRGKDRVTRSVKDKTSDGVNALITPPINLFYCRMVSKIPLSPPLHANTKHVNNEEHRVSQKKTAQKELTLRGARNYRS